MKHLIKTRNNSYTFRLIIPKSQRGYFQRTEIKKSLDTKNYIVANAKATILYNGYQEIVRVIKLGALSEEQIHQIVDKYVMNVLNEDKIKRATSTVKYEGVLLDMEAEQYQDFTTTVKDALRGNDFDVAKNIGAQLLKNLGITLNQQEPTHRIFLQTLLRGFVEITQEITQRARGEYSPKYDMRTPHNHSVVNLQQQIKGKSYQEAYEDFKVYYDDQKVAQATKDDTFRVLDRLMIIVGKDTNIENTKMTDLIKVKQKIENLPNMNFGKYKHLSFEEILKLKNIPDSDKISDNRAKDYLKHIKKFFSFCFDNGLIKFNPSVNLNITVASDKKDHFSDGEVKDLFSIFDTLEPHIKLLLYFYPYTGMRREELYNSTIEELNGIKYLDISKGKNSHSKRKIPLHSKLLELNPTNEMLNEARAKISHTSLGKLFNEAIKPQVTNSTKKTLHSFRHTVATKLQANGVADSLIQTIIGHSAKDTLNKVYARGSNLEAMREAIETITF